MLTGPGGTYLCTRTLASCPIELDGACRQGWRPEVKKLPRSALLFGPDKYVYRWGLFRDHVRLIGGVCSSLRACKEEEDD